MVKKKRPKKKRSEAFQKQNLFILVLLIIIFAITLFSYYYLDIPSFIKESGLRDVTFENQAILEVEVANTINELQRGLMNRESLAENRGMLFIFWEEKELDFWMKDTLISLDIIFLDSDKTIVKIVENVLPCEKEPCEVYGSESPALYVVEANAGYVQGNNIEVGQVVDFE